MKIKIIKTNHNDRQTSIIVDSKQVLFMTMKEDIFLEIYLPYNTRIVVNKDCNIYVTNEKKQSCPATKIQLFEAFYKE